MLQTNRKPSEAFWRKYLGNDSHVSIQCVVGVSRLVLEEAMIRHQYLPLDGTTAPMRDLPRSLSALIACGMRGAINASNVDVAIVEVSEQ